MAKTNTRKSRTVKGLPPLSPELLRSLTLDSVLGTIIDSLSSPVQRAKTNPLLVSAIDDLLKTKLHPPAREPQRNVSDGEEVVCVITCN